MIEVRLLHGIGADHRAFQRFARMLPDEWSVEALDLLGHGDAPHPEHGYSLADHADYIAGLITPAAPVILVGHSYGAAASVALAARHPQLVKAIVLLDPIVELQTADVGKGTASMIAAKRAGTLQQQVERLFPEASRALQAWTVQTWESMAMGVVDEFEPDWTPYADRVTCPVAVIHGELALGGGGDLSADWFDEPVMTCVEGAGHHLHASHAQETATFVIEAVTRFSGDA